MSPVNLIVGILFGSIVLSLNTVASEGPLVLEMIHNSVKSAGVSYERFTEKYHFIFQDSNPEQSGFCVYYEKDKTAKNPEATDSSKQASEVRHPTLVGAFSGFDQFMDQVAINIPYTDEAKADVIGRKVSVALVAVPVAVVGTYVAVTTFPVTATAAVTTGGVGSVGYQLRPHYFQLPARVQVSNFSIPGFFAIKSYLKQKVTGFERYKVSFEEPVDAAVFEAVANTAAESKQNEAIDCHSDIMDLYQFIFGPKDIQF